MYSFFQKAMIRALVGETSLALEGLTELVSKIDRSVAMQGGEMNDSYRSLKIGSLKVNGIIV